MAEGLVNGLNIKTISAFSAGSQPTTIHPFAVAAMREVGIDISSHNSKSFADIASMHFDYVITLCAGGELACPVFPGDYQQFHWPMADPSAACGSVKQRHDVFRVVRDDLKNRIEELLKHIDQS